MLINTLEEQYQKATVDDKKKIGIYKKLAWDRYLAMGLPTKKTEGFEYLPLDLFSQENFALYENRASCFEDEIIEKNIDPECAQSYIVLVNGEYAPELSHCENESIQVQTLSEAFGTLGSSLRGKMAEESQGTQSPFSLLNIALFHEGVFISIAKQSKLQKPLQVLHIVTLPTVIHPRIYLYLGKETEAELITRTLFVTENPAWVNETVEIWLEERSRLTHTDLTLFDADHHYYTSSLEASLKQKADYKLLLATNGSALMRKTCRAYLKGLEAASELKGIACLKGSSQAHIFTHFEHAAERTTSHQHMKSMLSDKARFSFDGKIYVTPQGLYSQAYQLNNNFLLSDKAAAFSKPNLEIFADDVKASHGCTTASISEEELFYLTSRGLGQQEAKELLKKAFIEEILQHIPNRGIYEAIANVFRV